MGGPRTMGEAAPPWARRRRRSPAPRWPARPGATDAATFAATTGGGRRGRSRSYPHYHHERHTPGTGPPSPTLLALLLLALAALIMPAAVAAATMAPMTAPTAECANEVLVNCPLGGLIPYREFSRAFPVIEYCLAPDRGFVPAERQVCEDFGLGVWTVRPDWARRNASLARQYACAVCTAQGHLRAAPEEEAVWVLTLARNATFNDADFQGWAAELGTGARLDQLVVSPSGARYLFAFARFKALTGLLAPTTGPRHILAAQPFPPELKISPRVADPEALEAATAAFSGGGGSSTDTDENGNSSTSLVSPSSSGSDDSGMGVMTLQIQTLVVEPEEGAAVATEVRAARQRDGVQRIRAALGLDAWSPEGRTDGSVEPEEVGIWTGNATSINRTSSSTGSSSSSSSATTCANCTVEAAGEGGFVVHNLPVPIAGAAARNISRALAAALVIDLAMSFKLFNREAAFFLQSGTNSTGAGAGRPLWDRGLTGASEVIGVADSGLDHTSCFFHDSAEPITFRRQFDTALGDYYLVFRSATHRKIREYFGYADSREGTAGGHGTHVCGSLAGHPAEMSAKSRSHEYRGAAYGARLALFDIGFPDEDWLEIPRDLATGLFPRTYVLGGRIHSNSWGSTIGGNGEEMHQTDRYLWEHQDFVILYAAGNDGANGDGTMGTPAEAKNSITVGATTNNLATPELAFFSSRGPTFDWRFGVDVAAPGYYVYSAYSFAGSGSAPNQCYIAAMAGTSMATPQLAGTTALLREYFTSGHYPLGYPNPAHAMVPMGALLKAVLVNSAQRMLDPEANLHNNKYGVTYPNFDQGFGAVALHQATYFDGGGSPNVLFVDGEWSEHCARCPRLSQGQTATYTILPTRSDVPLKITLAYYDYPASAAATSRALVNNLDLTATHAGVGYSANGAASPTAGVNTRNNVEQITIPRPEPGQPVTVRVSGTSIVRGPQPYAIVVTGQFVKDATLFPRAVPRVEALATDGEEALLIGANLPRSAAIPQTYNFTCLSNTSITDLTVHVTAYSAAAAFLAVRLSTTNCTRFSLQITSDGFIGLPATLSIGAKTVAGVCNQVASDSACQGLTACAGSCVATMAPPGNGPGTGGSHEFDRRTLIIVVCVLMAILVLVAWCCASARMLRQHEQRHGIVHTPSTPRLSRRGRDSHAPVAPVIANNNTNPISPPCKAGPPKPIRSPTGVGERAASPTDRRTIRVHSQPSSAPRDDRHYY